MISPHSTGSPGTDLILREKYRSFNEKIEIPSPPQDFNYWQKFARPLIPIARRSQEKAPGRVRSS